MNNLLILTQYPFVGFRPDDVRQWLKETPEKKNLALALSVVEEKAAAVSEQISDSQDTWAFYAAEEWEELEMELYREIERILLEENRNGANHDMTVTGRHYRILPFMERNGYRDGSGWWIKNEAIDSCE